MPCSHIAFHLPWPVSIVQRLQAGKLVAVAMTRADLSRGSTRLHVPDQRPKRFSVLRVSMVRIELCSMRTTGRKACKGIVGVYG